MAGGVIASVGPLLANFSKDLLPGFAAGDVFAGVYIMIAILYVASLLTLRFIVIPRPSGAERAIGRLPRPAAGPRQSVRLCHGRALCASLHVIMRQPVFIVAALGGMVGYVFAGVYVDVALVIPRPSGAERATGGRPLHVIMRQPVFIVAALGGMVGYMLMSLLMSATPLAMLGAGHTFFDTAQVIQWHVFAMFAPAFFTGHLIRRFGTTSIMGAGAVLIAVCVVINLAGIDLAYFWIGGMALGVGWCFLFVGATTLVTEAYSPAEKAKTQAANDFLVFGTVACAALLSGVLHEWIGWHVMNYIALPFLGAVLLALFAMLRARRRGAALAD